VSEHVGLPALRLRRARVDDLEQIVAVNRDSAVVAYREIFGETPFPVDRVRARFRRLLTSPDLVTVVAEAGGQAVGFIMAGARGVEALYVSPPAWGKGVGARLYEEIEPTLGKLATLWVLEANARGRCFWEGRDWRADGTSKIEHEQVELRYRLAREVRSG
jgi:GNAT superfamily N-acetyltransferase